MFSPSNFNTRLSSSPTSSTSSSPAQHRPKTPDFDPYADLKEQMRTAHEARVVATSACIEANYGRRAAIAWEIGQGVVHAPAELVSGSEESVVIEHEESVYTSTSEIKRRVGLILESGEPQKVLDRMECEIEVERKVWATATRALRERRGVMSKVKGWGNVVSNQWSF